MSRILFAAIFLIGLRSFADLDASKWSFRYLARASNVLLVASQQSLDQQQVVCHISGAKISSLSQNLKALVDAKIAHLSSAQKATIRKQAPDCKAECSCDIYAYYFETNSEAQDKSPTQAPTLTAAERLACAQNFSDFCQSQLLKFISK